MDDLETKRAEISEELEGLESELSWNGRRFYINELMAFKKYQGAENYFFTIRIGREHVGTAFPFRKLAFCGRPLHYDGNDDPVFAILKTSLEKRGYSVEYSFDLPYALLSRLNT